MNTPLSAASSIAVVTLASRILGLVRDVLMVHVLNFSWAMGTFALAWMVPNLLRRLFGEGALSSSFIPAYSAKAEQEGPGPARALLGSVTGMMLLALGALTCLALLLCWILPPETLGRGDEAVSDHEQGSLLLNLTIILFPYCIPICLAAIFAGALNAHGSFALPAASPVLLNLFWIAGLASALYMGLTRAADIVSLVAVFLLVGGVGQMLLSLLPLMRRGLIARPTLPGPGDPARQVMRSMVPTVIGMSLLQINAMLDQGLALYLIGPASSGFIYVANRLLLFPHALTSLALATAIFPQFSVLGAREDRGELRQKLDQSAYQTLVVAIPASLGMMLVAPSLIEVMFAQNDVAEQDLAVASWTTICLVGALPFIGISQLYARALYAIGDYRSPAWISFWLLWLNLGLNLLFVLGLGLGVPGLTLATTLASGLQALALRRRSISSCPATRGPPSILPVLFSAGIMALVVWALDSCVAGTTRLEKAIYDLALPVLGGVAIYALLFRLLRRAPKNH